MTNLLTRILTTLAVIPVAGVQAAPMANWGELDSMGVDNDHAILIQHVTATGIQFKINPGACWKKDNRGVFGWYSAYKNEMVICQTNTLLNYLLSMKLPQKLLILKQCVFWNCGTCPT